jgi:hypothetical protein
MKKITLLFTLVLLVYIEISVLLAQPKYQPKYLRQDDKAFNDLTIRTTDNGWIEFKKTARVNPNTFFKDFASNLGLNKDYNRNGNRFKVIKDETGAFQQKTFFPFEKQVFLR